MTETSSEGKSNRRFENFGRRVDETFGKDFGAAIPRIRDEIQKVAAYLNDEVVPHLRQDSSQALRSAAEQLGKLADYLDDNRRGGVR